MYFSYIRCLTFLSLIVFISFYINRVSNIKVKRQKEGLESRYLNRSGVNLKRETSSSLVFSSTTTGTKKDH